jgi:GAF domain-containing protein
MTAITREGKLVDAFATLADTLIADYDVIELLQTLVDSCHDLLDVEAAGILLANDRGLLEVIASTSEEANLVEVMQVDAESGPCYECFTTGQVVSLPDVDECPDRWPLFQETARAQGFGSVYAIPLRLRDQVIGTLNLLRVEPIELNARDIRAAQALADVATIGIVHQRTFEQSDVVRRQLHGARDAGRHRAGEGRRVAHPQRVDRPGLLGDQELRAKQPAAPGRRGATPRGPHAGAVSRGGVILRSL